MQVIAVFLLARILIKTLGTNLITIITMVNSIKIMVCGNEKNIYKGFSSYQASMNPEENEQHSVFTKLSIHSK